jgi:cyclic nucleotide gated channel, plant
MRHRQLPHELRERVRRFIHYKWLATRGVDEESTLQALPADLRRDIKRHLSLDLVCRVTDYYHCISFSRFLDGNTINVVN